MDRPFRAAITRCGVIACGNDALWLRGGGPGRSLTHAGAYRKNRNTALAAAADVDWTRLKRFGKDLGVAALFRNDLQEYV